VEAAVEAAALVEAGAVLVLSPQAANPIANNRPTINRARPVLNLNECLLNVPFPSFRPAFQSYYPSKT
jgi:hypothetical protein